MNRPRPMTERTSIACVGLGTMGRPAAAHLLAAGHQLHIYARRPDAAGSLLEAGAVLHPSPAAAAARARFAFTSVSATRDVEEVILGEDGLAEGMERGGMIIDMSSCAPASARQMEAELAGRGIDFLDAPVSGGEAGAQDATLAFMCGGTPEAFGRALPLLRLLGTSQVLVGAAGAGQVAKICNQVIIAATISALAESFRLAGRLDVDPALVREAIAGGFAGSRVLEVHGRRIIEGDFEPGFKARLHKKDLDIALAVAREAGVSLPCAKVFLDRLERMIELGHGEEDSSIAALAFES